ncbi:hypothetical protein P8C59_003192 [Phyllachora maydis]|uniref:Uncharacterized protein n=1 Tax=Phyllachora maydis TaxID=1825666 RepID=A0AAD9I0X7_9PEZI|nr:hypothetical protein P8C59_003192 [Phyllachora maydis]
MPVLAQSWSAELAQECEDQGWVVNGHLGQLHVALKRSLELIIQELKKQLRHWQEITAPQSTQQQVQLDQRNHGSPRVKRPAEEDLHRQYEPMS